MKEVILLPDGECYLRTDFLDTRGADHFFSHLKRTAVWRQPRLRLFGKTVRSPRLAAWYGDPAAVYIYSGAVHHPLPWCETLQQLRRQIEACTAARFNSVLLNLYRNGDDAMGWHSDDEKELAADAPIASLSLGAPRCFVMRHKRRKNLASVKIMLQHGSLLVMQGATQRHWRHAVPRTRKPVGARINLTFRLVSQAAVQPAS